MSVFDWLREQRLSQAACRVGFTSYSGFTKAFRYRFGVSHAEYRQTERA